MAFLYMAEMVLWRTYPQGETRCTGRLFAQAMYL
jgi:hypothetical protein